VTGTPTGGRQVGRVLGAALACVVAWAAPGQDLANPGAYAAGWRSVTVTRVNNSTFGARVYYPALSAGQNAPADASGGPYPCVSFGHGFLQPVTRYESTLLHLATHGFVVIASESGGELFPSHAAFAADLSRCLTYLADEGVRAGSFFEGLTDGARMALAGHSMGGGASLLAAASDPRVRLVLPLAAAETNPSAIAASEQVRCAVIHLAGTNDTIVPPGPNGVAMANATPAPNQMLLIQGGFHCGFQDVSSFGCDSGPMARATQLTIVRREMTRALLLYLHDDAARWREVWGPERTPTASVQVTSTPRFTLAGAGEVVAVPVGASAGATLTLTHALPGAQGFTLFAEGPEPRPVMEPAMVDDLAPATPAEVTLTIDGAGLARGEPREWVIAAAWNGDGASAAWTTLRVVGVCNPDVNADGNVDQDDVACLALAVAGDASCAAIDPDFNADGNVDQDDVDALAQVVGGGSCD
jgi:dienelactone hydrolase